MKIIDCQRKVIILDHDKRTFYIDARQYARLADPQYAPNSDGAVVAGFYIDRPTGATHPVYYGSLYWRHIDTAVSAWVADMRPGMVTRIFGPNGVAK